MKIAVTGASGFIGRYVVAALAQMGQSPVVVLRPGSAARTDFAHLRIADVDIADPPADVFAAIGSPDLLIHLAWAGLPKYSSLHHFESELGCQYRFLKSLVLGGLKSLVVTGTCFEYGMQTGRLREDAAPQPVTPYGFAKDALRRQLEFLRTQNDFALTWARLFYTYGEGQSESSLYTQLKRAAQSGQRVFNMSGGEQLRDFLPVAELAELLAVLALRAPGAGIVNVCSGTPRSIRSWTEQWMAANGWNVELNLGFYPYPKHEPMAFWGDRTRLEGLLGSAMGRS